MAFVAQILQKLYIERGPGFLPGVSRWLVDAWMTLQ